MKKAFPSIELTWFFSIYLLYIFRTTQKALQLEKPEEKGARNIAVIREIPVPKEEKGKFIVKVSGEGKEINQEEQW